MKVVVSVVVPVRNGETSIVSCLRSILAAEPPAGGMEVVVVDNDSTDATARIIRSFPVLYLSAAGRPGSYYARNVGAAQCSGNVLAFTDADCEVDRRWLISALPRFCEAGVALVGGRIVAGDSRTRPAWYQCRTGALDQEHTLNLTPMPYAQTANFFVRRETFERVGGFDETFRSGGDADLCWRLQVQGVGRIVYEPSCLVVHHHRSTWRGVFRQTLGHTKGLLALEEKYRAVYAERGVPRRLTRTALGALGHAVLAIGGRGAAFLGAALAGRPDTAWRCYGDLVRSAAFHAAVCGRKMGLV